MLSRPWSDVRDFLVDDHSIWYSDGMTLRGVDIETNQVTATIEAVGIPFALGDGAVWTYNRKTQVITGVDTKTGQIRTQLATQGRPYHHGSFTFGAGSIWQFAYAGSLSLWQARFVDHPPLPSVIRRIDPSTKKVLAEIPVGLFNNEVDMGISPYRIHFVAGAIWILGKSGIQPFLHPGHVAPFVKRIDVETSRVIATIPLSGTVASLMASEQYLCQSYSDPLTPVYLDGGIWISLHCGRARSALLKIDLQTNQLDGGFSNFMPGVFEPANYHVLVVSHPRLTVTGDSLWGFGVGAAIRFDF